MILSMVNPCTFSHVKANPAINTTTCTPLVGMKIDLEYLRISNESLFPIIISREPSLSTSTPTSSTSSTSTSTSRNGE